MELVSILCSKVMGGGAEFLSEPSDAQTDCFRARREVFYG